MQMRFDAHLIDEVDPAFELHLREEDGAISLTLDGFDSSFEMKPDSARELASSLRILADRVEKQRTDRA